MFKRRNIEPNSLRRALTVKPYFTNETSNTDSYWLDKDVTRIFYNPNLFYGHTNFKHSNIYGAAVNTFPILKQMYFLKMVYQLLLLGEVVLIETMEKK